ncbi:unnamed protein product [Cercospora beticola]|nr:unnamed protein product [Cercospora beticola]
MATETDPKSRMFAQTISKRDFYASISRITLHMGASLGFAAALIRPTYHIVKGTPVWTGFLHTTGLWATMTVAFCATIPLQRYIDGAPSAFDTYKERSGAAANTEDDRHTSEKITRVVEELRASNTCAGVSVVFGAAFVAIRHGFRRGNFFRTVGGACAGLELYRVTAPWVDGTRQRSEQPMLT